jgi:hypothetical protein
VRVTEDPAMRALITEWHGHLDGPPIVEAFAEAISRSSGDPSLKVLVVETVRRASGRASIKVLVVNGFARPHNQHFD